MISSVRGVVLSVAGTSAVASSAVIEVGGIGLAVSITPQHALTLRVGAEAIVRTALIVREDDLSLFGFADADELAVFDLLRGVTGVGPKSAMGVLAAMTPAQIATAVGSEDDGAFRKVSGIGPKTAKLIIVSLAGKMQGIALSAAAAKPSSPSSIGDSVVNALVGLGWQERLAVQTVDDVLTENPGATLTVPALLRFALAQLGPHQAGSTASTSASEGARS
ncbi:Holliday junction branch migration protein RuvA [soil metagenome]